ncbi:MAG: hypothetical protein ABI298_01060, partial [Acidimicrobiales bacterium]
MARRHIFRALDEALADSSVSIDSLELPGGVVECMRIETQRLYPLRRFEIVAKGHDLEGRQRSFASHDGAASSETELSDSLAVLNAHSAQFRPVIEAALGRDELARLRPLLDESKEGDARDLDAFSGRVLLRAAPTAKRPEPEQREKKLPDEALPREGTPAARA